MSVMRALCCGGRGGAARVPVDRGMLLLRVVVALWSGRRGSVPCRRCVRVWFSGLSICLVGCPWCCVGMMGSAYEGTQVLGAWPVENRVDVGARPSAFVVPKISLENSYRRGFSGGYCAVLGCYAWWWASVSGWVVRLGRADQDDAHLCPGCTDLL